MFPKSLSKIVTVFGLSACLMASPAISFAQTATNSGLSQRQEIRTQNLHTRCDSEINLRLTSLNSLSSKIPVLKRLSSAEKTQFETEIQNYINGLTNLKAKCDTDTNLQTLISDVKSIYSNYRIYAVFIPQLRLLVAADMMETTADNLSTLADKLDQRIQQNEGKNISYLNSDLADMRNQIKDAQNNYTNVENQIINLIPSSYPGSTPILIEARTELKTGTIDLKTAISNAKTIIRGLKALEPKNDTSITSTPSPTPAQ